MMSHAPVVLILTLFFLSCDVSGSIEKMASENMRRGNDIVREIDGYRSRTGSYPQSLEELERAASKSFSLPVAPAEPRWFYEATGDGYELSFSTDGYRRYPVWFYASSDRQWHSDQ